jgi:agmatine deiminase
MKTKIIGIITIILIVNINSYSQYIMPPETEQHEGTWLQWPHQYEYGITYRNRLDATWVAMTSALVGSEKVHIIAYNSTEQNRITNLLTNAGVSLANIDFKLFPTNDVWVRDNGPIFVRDTAGNLYIEDWGFNGWGGDYNFNLDNPIPMSVATAIGLPVVNLDTTMIVEGGAIEIDGNGVLMATKSSILTQTNSNGALAIRNPGMTQAQAEAIFTQYLGVTKFIWLDGFLSTDDITDAHIDGFAKFANDSTLVTMSNADLTYWGLSSTDIATLYAASNVNNVQYNKAYVPLTQNNVVTTYGNNLGYKGSYCNYYIANNVVLVPNYNDPNDTVANAIIQGLYPNRTVVGIDVRNLYENGGMIHCVTQQQPIDQNASSINTIEKSGIKIGEIYPNPTNTFSSIKIILKEKSSVELFIYDIQGKKIVSKHETLQAGKNEVEIDTSRLKSGIYTYLIKVNNDIVKSDKLIVK